MRLEVTFNPKLIAGKATPLYTGFALGGSRTFTYPNGKKLVWTPITSPLVYEPRENLTCHRGEMDAV